MAPLAPDEIYLQQQIEDDVQNQEMPTPLHSAKLDVYILFGSQGL